MTATALFCGDIAFDVALRVSRHPDADEKTHAFENLVSADGVAANSAVACARQGVATTLLAVVGDDVLAPTPPASSRRAASTSRASPRHPA